MRSRWLLYVLVVAPLAWFFGAVLWRGDVLDFRDIGHYYRPLWRWTSSEWAAGRVPLWCELDGLGMPVHADPTASVFYPGQLFFALPLDFDRRLQLYLIAHLLLAAALLYRTARVWNATPCGAAAGALAYAYGGHVLFQYCNPVYLVGAAWLPLAALAIERVCTTRSSRWVMALAASMALIILGGDPQLAYHVALAAVIYRWLMGRDAATMIRAPGRPLPVGEGRGEGLRGATQLLTVAFVFAFALAAVQLLPTMSWAPRSERALAERPRSIWEAPRAPREALAGMLRDPAHDTHHERIYDFSVAPWRWLEFVWPNVGGQMFPIHRRWMSVLPAEGRVWSPSLYLGLAPLLAALAAFNVRKSAETTTRWLWWLTVIGLVGSLGVYGLGWLIEEVRCGLLGGDPAEKPMHGAVGGLYWLFVVLLPGYVQFRYPAKLMVLASLGLSLLAAKGWPRLFEWHDQGPLRWLWRGALAVVLGGGAVIVAAALVLRSQGFDVPAEFPFGPLDVEGAARDACFAAAQAALVVVAVWWLAVKGTKFAWRSQAIVALTALELCVAHGWLISASPHVPQEPVAGRVYRGEIDQQTPPEWLETSSPTRVAELLAWTERTLGEKTYLAAGAQVVDARGALDPADIAAVWRAARRHGEEGLETLGPLTGLDGSAVYVPQRVETLHDEMRFRRPSELWFRTDRLFFDAHGQGIDRRQMCFIERPKRPNDVLFPRIVYELEVPKEALRLTRVSPTRVEIETDLPEQRWIVLADYYAPGWQARIEDRATGETTRAEIVRANRILRGVEVPPGKQRVVFVYRPLWLYVGGVVSGVAWCVMLGLAPLAPLRGEGLGVRGFRSAADH